MVGGEVEVGMREGVVEVEHTVEGVREVMREREEGMEWLMFRRCGW